MSPLGMALTALCTIGCCGGCVVEVGLFDDFWRLVIEHPWVASAVVDVSWAHPSILASLWSMECIERTLKDFIKRFCL